MNKIKVGRYKSGNMCMEVKENVKGNVKGIIITIDSHNSFFFNADGSYDGFGISTPNVDEIEEFEKYINNTSLEAICPLCDFVYELGKEQIPFTQYRCPRCKELYIYEG